MTIADEFHADYELSIIYSQFTLNITTIIFPIDQSFNICIPPGSQFWLFRDLSLQEGYPQPLSALRLGVNFTGRDDDDGKVEIITDTWGLVWDPEDGPVWGNTEIYDGEDDNNTWNQLIKAGVSGIVTERDGDESDISIWMS